MTRRRGMVRVAMLSLGVVLLAGVGGWLWFLYEFRLDISRSDIEPFETTVKKAASDVFVVKRPDSNRAGVSGGYLVAYQGNPEGFRNDARLFDAWMASVKLGLAVLKNTPPGNWVRSSGEADYVAVRDRVDPWNHTFCFLRRNDDVLVVSGGPKAPSSPVCRDIQLTAKDLAELPQGKLLESPSGYLVLAINNTHVHQAK